MADDADLLDWAQNGAVWDYAAAYEWAVRHFHSKRWYAYAVSTGGIAALRLIESGAIPRPRALVLVSAVTNLAAADSIPYLQGSLSPYFGGANSSLPMQTASLDPMLLPLGPLSRVPILAFASPQDTVAVAALNSDSLAQRVGSTMKVIEVSGSHVSGPQFIPGKVLRFYGAHK